MTVIIILAFALSSSLMFPLMAQPLSLGLTIMISTLLMCMLSATFLSAWYAYILFLIYVGGLLVMFAYVAALSPNVLFGGASALIFFLVMTIIFSYILHFYPFTDYSETVSYKDFCSNKNLKSHGIELVSPSSISILIGLGMILLINLVAVVKISYYQHSSLRPFMKS
uniref:NADH dehydrogenase subunit 6 n=1 Tax=Alviniconcha adamantis TaxID=1491184 RepID=UPI0026E2B3AF|nr:NADH dehydrogenase subunit 6 [Alviniconcha adamantis]WJK73043.1 NADH dehydrogenase subunit 6 [Alviniconcha adamantis]